MSKAEYNIWADNRDYIEQLREAMREQMHNPEWIAEAFE
jgi:uncharacterized protein YnzC (UPF0291/DUF896 family)